MKRITWIIAVGIFSILFVFAASSCSASKPNFNKPALNNKLTVRTTAYTHSESDHVKYGRKNAVGTKLQCGNVRSAAADWSVFPVGTQFKIEGRPEIFVIDDYGSALVGTKTIDIYQTSKKGMRNWGVRHVNIEILKWGSYTKSKEIISDRTKYPHIRKMLAAINNKNSAGNL
jgi:3D (Asp-Asp-Asp) domain-containing protein